MWLPISLYLSSNKIQLMLTHLQGDNDWVNVFHSSKTHGAIQPTHSVQCWMNIFIRCIPMLSPRMLMFFCERLIKASSKCMTVYIHRSTEPWLLREWQHPVLLFLMLLLLLLPVDCLFPVGLSTPLTPPGLGEWQSGGVWEESSHGHRYHHQLISRWAGEAVPVLPPIVRGMNYKPVG